MDIRNSVSIVPPAGSQPTRAKSLRQQRASNGANIIKAYVKQSEQRREQSKFHATGARHDANATMLFGTSRLPEDERYEPSTPPASARGMLSPQVSSHLSPSTSPPFGSVSPSRHTEASNQNQDQDPLDDAHALDALFAERRMRRSRRTSVIMSPRPNSVINGDASSQIQPTASNGYSSQDLHANTNTTAIKPIMRKRLQMEIAMSANANGGIHTGGSGASTSTTTTSGHHHGHHHHPAHTYRPPAVASVPHHPRTKHNLGAKLDAIAKNSLWNRRKVLLTTDDRASKTISKPPGSPRHGNQQSVAHASGSHTIPSHGGHHHGHSLNQSHRSHGDKGCGSTEQPESEIEMRVMAAFRQIVRLWRERKRRAEAVAVGRINGNNTNGISTGTGRNGSKLRKDLAAQSGNVVGILSRRIIREVPALKYFDDDHVEAATLELPSKAGGGGVKLPSRGALAAVAKPPELRVKPRGVCYTLDAFGCRKIKMQSSTCTATAATAGRDLHHQAKAEPLTLEKAMTRSLRRKMARRVRARRLAIVRLSTDFSKSRRDLSMKLKTQLALQRAQIEKMFSKRLTLLMSDDTSLPPYMAQKELHLARLRCKKANLLEKCETLRVLALALKKVEAAGEASGVEVTTGELHFLDLFRCVVEENQVLTPLISHAIRQHMRSQDLHQPMIMDLFHTLNTEIQKNATS